LTEPPLVSVVVPNWNGDRFIRPCLASLARQSYPRLEIIVVDDASTDGSAALIAREFPEIELIRLARNRGFAHAVNVGITRSSGGIVALLNNDAVAEVEWVVELVGALDRHPEAGSVASKMLLWDRPQVLNSAGDLFRRSGVPDNRGAWEEDRGQYDEEMEVFGASGGAAAYRRSMLDEIGLFDEQLSMYCEDVDLAFRAQIAGYRCVYAPRARVFHRLSASGGGTLASYQCGRNFVWLLARDVPIAAWRRDWRLMVRTQLGLTLRSLRHFREPAARAWLRGQVAGILTAPRLALQRPRLYRHRRVSDGRLLALMS
jgi:GT2 family glycosyltransferase